MLDTHEVHQKKKIVKDVPLRGYYHVCHPRGAFKEEDHQERSSSTYYHVRHPRGAFKEEDRQERSSSTYYVRHPRGASKEEGRQGRSSSACYHVTPTGFIYRRRSSRTLLFKILSS